MPSLKLISRFFVGLLLTSAALSLVLPHNPHDSYVPTFSEKLGSLQRDDGKIDVLVVGTSRAFAGVNPPHIEALLSAQGIEANVWNMALLNLSFSEVQQVVGDSLEHSSLAPALVLWEPSLRVGMPLANATSARAVYFSDWTGYRRTERFIRSAARSGVQKLYNSAVNHFYFLVNRLNYGRLTDAVFPGRYDFERHLKPRLASMLRNHGYWPPEVDVYGAALRQFSAAEREKQAAKLSRALVQEQSELQRSEGLPDSQAQVFRDFDAWLREQGCASLMLVMPKLIIEDAYYRRTEYQLLRSFGGNLKTPDNARDATDVEALGADQAVDLIQYLSHHDHRDLYRIENWNDSNHLSSAGADLLSEDLAARIAERLLRAKTR